MKFTKPSETQVLTSLAVLSLLTGSVCLILAFQHKTLPMWNLEENVTQVNSVIPSPVPSEGILPYVWQLTDIYEISGERLHLREKPKSSIHAAFDLVWEGSLGGRVQIAPDPQFIGNRIHLESKADVLNVSQLFVGENFWRVSRDGRLWSQALRFVVEPEFLPGSVDVTFSGSAAVFHASTEMTGYIVEFSRSAEFTPSGTFVFSRIGSRLPWDQPGFMRIRGVNSKAELTGYSPVVKIEKI